MPEDVCLVVILQMFLREPEGASQRINTCGDLLKVCLKAREYVT